MRVKNKETGEVVGMHYGIAMDAVAAGTHEVVHEESAGIAPGTDAELKSLRAAGVPVVSGGAAKPEQPLPKPDVEGNEEVGEEGDDEGEEEDDDGADGEEPADDGLGAMTKDQLLAEANLRGRNDVKPTMRKDEIIAALRG